MKQSLGLFSFFSNESLVRLSYCLSIAFSQWHPSGRTCFCKGAVCPQGANISHVSCGWWLLDTSPMAQRSCASETTPSKRSAPTTGEQAKVCKCCLLLSGRLGKAEISLMRVGNQEPLLGSSGRIQAGKRFQEDKHITFYQSLLIWEQACLFFPQLSSIMCRKTKSMHFLFKVTE